MGSLGDPEGERQVRPHIRRALRVLLGERQDPGSAFLPVTDAEGLATFEIAFRPSVENEKRAYALCGVHGADEADDCAICAAAERIRLRYLIETVHRAHEAYGERGFVAGWREGV